MADKPSLMFALKGSGLPKSSKGQELEDDEDDTGPVSAEQIQTSEDIIRAVKRGDAESLAVLLQTVTQY